MTDAFSFESTTPRLGLPMLFAGQAHKDVFVNEALSRLDAIMHCCIVGISAVPPENPGPGETWLVASDATGGWSGMSDHVASYQAGNWVFVAPREGMRIYDGSRALEMRFSQTWQSAQNVAEPIGGLTVDSEARSAIISLITALRAMGVLPSG